MNPLNDKIYAGGIHMRDTGAHGGKNMPISGICMKQSPPRAGHAYLMRKPKLSYMTHMRTNVSVPERLLSVAGGATLLYDIITKRKTNFLQTMAGSYLILRGVTGFCIAYDQLGKREVDYRTPNVNIRTSLIVNRPRDQVYAFWRRLQNLPLFMKHLQNVTVLDEKLSEWTAVLIGDVGSISWTSEIVKDDPGALLSWHSVPESSIENAGKITFEDAGLTGTRVDIVISYHAPLGILGEKAARLLNPMFEKMVRDDVNSFKEYIETAELPITQGRLK